MNEIKDSERKQDIQFIRHFAFKPFREKEW